jgi:hypothetical protein
MDRFKSTILTAAGLIGLGGLAAPAFASDIIADSVQVPYSENLTLTGKVDSQTQNVDDPSQISGQIVLSVQNYDSITQKAISAPYTLAVWCVDIFHDIDIGNGTQYPYSVGSLSTDNSDNPSVLNATQISDIEDLVAYGDYEMQKNPTNAISAQVQATIWMVEYNNSEIGNSLTVRGGDVTGDLSSGSIYTTLMKAETYVAEYGGSAGQLSSLTGAQAEAYATPAPLIGSGVPGVLAVGGILFGAALWGRRPRRLLPGTTANPQSAA